MEMTETGITNSDGKEHEVDLVIFATGFNTVDGNYTRVRAEWRGVKESLKGRVGKHLGVCVPNFPNLFLITRPNRPFTNIPAPLTIEMHVVFIMDAIEQAESNKRVAEATLEAEKG
jgi:cation diffusion facilitator CzcD-associated flavoprotein CzcO